jgi:hypothetical protein
MTKLTLIKTIDKAIISKDAIAIVVEIKTETGINHEFIINAVANLKAKRDYYFSNYDEDCRLSSNPTTNKIIAIYVGKDLILRNVEDYLNAK